MVNKDVIDGPAIAARILSHLSVEEQERLVEHVREIEPRIAVKISNKLASFEKLANVTPTTLQNVLHEVAQRDIAISLKTASPEVRTKILQNVSKKKEELVRSDLAELPPMHRPDIEAAQQRILRKLDELYPEESKAAEVPSTRRSRLA